MANPARGDFEILAGWLELRARTVNITTEETCRLQEIAEWLTQWSRCPIIQEDAVIREFVNDCAIEACIEMSDVDWQRLGEGE